MRDIIIFLSKAIILLMSFILIGAMLYNYNKNYYGYEYITLKDEFGIASKCYMNNNGLYCKTKDGLVDVKQYRKR